jgi:Ion channel
MAWPLHSWFQMLLGLLLVGLVVADLLASSMHAGEGRLTRLVHRPIYSVLHGLFRVSGNRSVMAWTSSVLVVGAIVSWTLMTWLGWTLVFSAVPGAVISVATEDGARLADVVYFVGYSLSTLGLGDFVTQGQPWRTLHTLCAFNGFFIITFAITFVVPVAQAQAQRRELALATARYGRTAQGLVLEAAQESASGLDALVSNQAQRLITLDLLHLNAPFLHRFHEKRLEESMEVGLAALDEALSIIEHGLDRPPPKGLNGVRRSIGSLLLSYERVHPHAALLQPPPAPSLELLRRAGLPVRGEDDFAARLQLGDLPRRRATLHDMVQRGGWNWSDVELDRPEHDQPEPER